MCLFSSYSLRTCNCDASMFLPAGLLISFTCISLLNLLVFLSDVIDELVKSGKEIEAVYFSSESGLTERFSPVSLLKSCLKNCRKSANSVSKSGNYSMAAVVR